MDLSSQYAIPTNDVVSFGDTAVTAAATGFVVDGKIVDPGGSAVTVDGTVVSLDMQSHLKIGSNTVLLTSAVGVSTTSPGSGNTGLPTPAGFAGASNILPTNLEGPHSGGVVVVRTGSRVTILVALGLWGMVLNL